MINYSERMILQRAFRTWQIFHWEGSHDFSSWFELQHVS